VAVFGLDLPRLGMVLALPVLIVIGSWPATSSTGRTLINCVVLTVGSGWSSSRGWV
jgi:hypothetical protein